MRDLKNLTNEQAGKTGWEIVKPCNSMEVVAKAVFEDTFLKIMKSTKRFRVEGGWIYNTSTETHTGSNIAVAEALVFVPDVI